MADDKRIVVIGLGYVGLPRAVALAKSYETWGLDIDISCSAELKRGHDRTCEIDSDSLSPRRCGSRPIPSLAWKRTSTSLPYPRQ